MRLRVCMDGFELKQKRAREFIQKYVKNKRVGIDSRFFFQQRDDNLKRES